MVLKRIAINLKLPLLDIRGEWEPQELERQAAWELYVELVTRVPLVELHDDEGVLREALSSLYSLFGTTREILRKYGPGIAGPMEDDGSVSFGYLAVALLNGALRPLLARWHPRLEAHEAGRPDGISAGEYEEAWDLAAELRTELKQVGHVLNDYAVILAAATGAPSLLRAVDETRRPGA
jgi:hypothetical protein